MLPFEGLPAHPTDIEGGFRRCPGKVSDRHVDFLRRPTPRAAQDRAHPGIPILLAPRCASFRLSRAASSACWPAAGFDPSNAIAALERLLDVAARAASHEWTSSVAAAGACSALSALYPSSSRVA